MKTRTLIEKLLEWIRSTELFFNPLKIIPGRWCLYEYYTETQDELFHVQEEHLKEKNLLWEIEFYENQSFTCKSNLAVPLMEGSRSGTWRKAGNFLSFTYSGESPQKIDFQFAIDKGILKLLKKSSLGKIEIFGFLRKAV